MESSAPAWSAALFTSRESIETLSANVEALRQAGGESLAIHVLVNGQRGLADAFAARMAGDAARFRGVSLWFCPFGDKAHAWNEFIHRVWDGRSWAFNVDGYVTVLPGTLQRLLDDLRDHPGHLAATGVPTIGRSSAPLREAMLRDSGLHGNLFLLRPQAVQAFRDAGFRLPVGLYRTDSTIGAVLAFAMDPATHEWSPRTRLWVDPEVTWLTPQKAWWRLDELRAWWRRAVRQARGRLENAAVRHHLAIRKRAPGQMAGHVELLIREWVRDDPRGAARLMRAHPLAWRYWRQIRAAGGGTASPATPPPMQPVAAGAAPAATSP